MQYIFFYLDDSRLSRQSWLHKGNMYGWYSTHCFEKHLPWNTTTAGKTVRSLLKIKLFLIFLESSLFVQVSRMLVIDVLPISIVQSASSVPWSNSLSLLRSLCLAWIEFNIIAQADGRWPLSETSASVSQTWRCETCLVLPFNLEIFSYILTVFLPYELDLINR